MAPECASDQVQAVPATPTDLVATLSADANVDTHVAPQVPDVASGEATAKQKATRAVRAPKRATVFGQPREASKTSQMIAMLKRESGTTLEEIMTATGWQKHTKRAILSAGGSLAKNHGLSIASEKVGDQRVYSIKA